MNFLAHLYLSSPEPDALLGSLMPDLVRGPLPANLPVRIAQACYLHRCVDTFTDTHPLFIHSKQCLSHRHGIFSGILVDVFYDHYLARDWSRYDQRPLKDFVTHVYRSFEAQRAIIPSAMHLALDHMIQQNWLEAYATVAGIRLTLERMSRRFSKRFTRQVNLADAADDLVHLNQELAADFHEFFPQLIAYASTIEPQIGRGASPVNQVTPPVSDCPNGG